MASATLEDMRPQMTDELGAELAEQFVALIEGRPDEDAFEAAAFDYFDLAAANNGHPDPYFNWIGEFALPRAGTPIALVGLWEWAAGIAHKWEGARGKHQHKGTGYYFAGLRDAMLGDLDRAFLYVHQAAVEDAWPDRDHIPASPAGWFITMDIRREDQTAYPLVNRWANYLAERLAEYRSAGRGSLDSSEIHRRVADHPALVGAMPAIAHAVARLVSLGPSRALRIHDNRYSALLLTQVELELCLVIEDVLSDAVADAGWTLSKLIAQYPPGHGVSLDKRDLDAVIKLANATGGFDKVMAELLAGQPLSGFHRELTDQESDLIVALLARNTSAHGLDRPMAVADLFDQIVSRLFFALFAAIEALYP